MSWIWAALMPHPPVIIPAVGQGRERDAAATLDGARTLCERLSRIHAASDSTDGRLPDAVLLLSPHHHAVPGRLFLNNAAAIRGNLAAFGAPSAAVYARTPKDALEELASALHAAGIPIMQGAQEDISRDHGALVPLVNLAPCFPGGNLPPVILAGPSGLSQEAALRLGKALGTLHSHRRWALLASGDLSHRLIPGAPAGYSPDGAVFDRTVVEALEKGDPSLLSDLEESVRENAGECGLRPVLTLLGLAAAPVRVLSYEGPFGVGYCNALWTPKPTGRVFTIKSARGAKTPPEVPVTGHPYARLARMTIEKYLSGLPAPDAREIDAIAKGRALWNERSACFVSIKGKDDSLRGCIGTILPTQNSLKEEIMANAVSAAVSDPRFPPMQAGELEGVAISVDVLGVPEEVREGMALDPAIWGVIVTKGARRGLLLPDLPGVDTVERQIAIAAHKAGIRNLEGIQLQRFSVSRHSETEPWS